MQNCQVRHRIDKPGELHKWQFVDFAGMTMGRTSNLNILITLLIVAGGRKFWILVVWQWLGCCRVVQRVFFTCGCHSIGHFTIFGILHVNLVQLPQCAKSVFPNEGASWIR